VRGGKEGKERVEPPRKHASGILLGGQIIGVTDVGTWLGFPEKASTQKQRPVPEASSFWGGREVVYWA